MLQADVPDKVKEWGPKHEERRLGLLRRAEPLAVNVRVLVDVDLPCVQDVVHERAAAVRVLILGHLRLLCLFRQAVRLTDVKCPSSLAAQHRRC